MRTRKPDRVLTMTEAKALAVLRDALALSNVTPEYDAARAEKFRRRMLRALRWTPGGGRRAAKP